MRIRITVVLVLASTMLGGCGGAPSWLADAGGGDAGVPVTSVDASRRPTQDAGQHGDRGIDGGAIHDSGIGLACEPANECELASYVGDACTRAPVEDGVGCGKGICVGGACVTRGCGDGYREHGPAPEREGCDDGNHDDVDGCSSTCTPAELVVAAGDGGRDAPFGPAASVGVDGVGRVLMLWRAELTAGIELRAQRFSAGGAPADGAVMTLTSTPGPLWASVAGLRGGGWVVTWSEPAADGDMAGVLFRLISPDGAIGPATVASEETFLDQSRPSVTAVGDGFVIAWNDQSQLLGTGPSLRARARWFAFDGHPISAEIGLSADPTEVHQDPVVAASGPILVAAWVVRGDSPSIRLRRFDSAVAMDAADRVVAPAAATEPAIDVLRSGEAVVVWRDGHVDPYGDIWGARVSITDGTVSAPFAITSSAPPYGVRSADLAPAVARLGEGFAVIHQQYRNEQGLRIVTVDVDPSPPELEQLRSLLAESTAGDGSIGWSPRGLWSTWSTGTDPSEEGAWRSVVAFLLAED